MRNNTDITINLEDLNRDKNIVVFKSNVFEADTYYHAYELALNSINKSMNLNFSKIKDVNKGQNRVKDAIEKGIVNTWSSFKKGSGKYLICNTKEDFFKYYKLKSIQKYATKNDLDLGYLDENNNVIIPYRGFLKFKLEDLNKDKSIVVYRGNVHEAASYHYAYEQALRSVNRSMNLKFSRIRDVKKAQMIINDKVRKGIINTWSTFKTNSGKYLVCTTKEDFIKCYKLKSIQEYATKYNLGLGYKDENNNVIIPYGDFLKSKKRTKLREISDAISALMFTIFPTTIKVKRA